MKLGLQFLLLIVICYCATIPEINYYQSYASYSYPAHPNDTCSKLMVTDSYVFRLGSNNVISVVNKTSLNTKSFLLNYTYSNGVSTNQNSILDFDVDQNQTYLTLSQTSSTKILNMNDFSLKWTSTTSPFYKISFNNLLLSGTIHTALADVFYKYTVNPLLGVLIVLPAPTILVGVKNCNSVQSPDRKYIVYWDQYTNVFVYDFSNSGLFPVYIGQITSNSKKANLTQTITFSSDSQYFIVEADSKLPVKIVSLVTGQLLRVRSFYFNGVINKAMFLDSQNAYIALFNDTALTLVETSTLSIVNVQQLSIFTPIIEIDYGMERVYFCKNTGFQVYNLSLQTINIQTTNCSSNCQSCSNSDICEYCNYGFELVNSSCVAVQSSSANASSDTQNTTDNSSNYTSPAVVDNTNSSANPSNSIYNFNLSDINVTQDSNHSFIVMLMPDGSVIVLEVTFVQEQILNNTRAALTISNAVLQKLVLFLSSSPYIYLCLSNIQFFTTSCLYAILNVPIPEMVYSTLMETAAALSSNMFSVFGINVPVPDLGVERISDQKYLKFGISSLFLPNNYQYMTLSVVIIGAVYFLGFLLSLCQPVSRIFSMLLDHNKSSVLFGLIVSGMSPIILPYLNIYENPYSQSFYDKLNQAIQFLAIGVALAIGALFIAFQMKNGESVVKMKKKTILFIEESKKKKKASIPVIQKLKNQRDDIYIIILNLSFPLFVIIGQPAYFLAVIQIVLLSGLYKDTKAKKYKVNKIILGVYPIIFHICFIIFYLSSNPSILVITEIICILTYFLGSLHEFLTMLAELVIFLYKIIMIKIPSNKIHQKSEETQRKNQEKSLKASNTIIFTSNSKFTLTLSTMRNRYVTKRKQERNIFFKNPKQHKADPLRIKFKSIVDMPVTPDEPQTAHKKQPILKNGKK